MSPTWLDVRYACRVLGRSPGFLSIAVLTLALGIGANTAIFSLIDTVVLRQLPVEEPGSLVLLTDPGSTGLAVDTREVGEREIFSYPEFERLREHNTVFSGMTAFESAPGLAEVRTTFGKSERQTRARCQLVSGEYFEVLAIGTPLGRLLNSSDDRPNASPVAVISHALWQRLFHRDPAVLGQTIQASHGAFSIVGVAPEGFRGVSIGAEIDVWIPMAKQELMMPGRNHLAALDTLWLQVMARLRKDIPREAAQTGINLTFQQVLKEWPDYVQDDRGRDRMFKQWIVLRDGSRGSSSVRAQFSDPLLLLMGMVGLVLLIACANIANLTLARATRRQREMGVRLALGAGRFRLIRQLLTESLLLSAAGGALGVLFAVWGSEMLVSMVSSGLNEVQLEVRYDWRVFAFSAAVSLLTSAMFGMFPALRASRVDINRTLSATARGSSSARGSARTGRVLVAVQVALSILLLVAATLMARSLHNLVTQRLGFQRDRLLMARVDLIKGGYRVAAVPRLHQQLSEKLLTLPGVQAVTASKNGLFAGDSGDRISLDVPAPQPPDQMWAGWDLVGANYFRTLGIPILRGREISAEDVARRLRVCVINETMARFFFPDRDPIGHRVTDEYPTTRETYEIIGVVADARSHQLRGETTRRFYANIAVPIGDMSHLTFLLRTRDEADGMIEAVRRSVAEVDRALPVTILAVQNQIDRRLVTERLIAYLAAAFGALALALSGIGLYGVMSYAVSLRTNEIGLRMALGAERGTVVWMVLRETLVVVALGAVAGVPGAMLAAGLLSSRLFGLTPADPASMAATLTVVAAAAGIAGYLPARRASRVDPMVALRDE